MLHHKCVEFNYKCYFSLELILKASNNKTGRIKACSNCIELSKLLNELYGFLGLSSVRKRELHKYLAANGAKIFTPKKTMEVKILYIYIKFELKLNWKWPWKLARTQSFYDYRTAFRFVQCYNRRKCLVLSFWESWEVFSHFI